ARVAEVGRAARVRADEVAVDDDTRRAEPAVDVDAVAAVPGDDVAVADGAVADRRPRPAGADHDHAAGAVRQGGGTRAVGADLVAEDVVGVVPELDPHAVGAVARDHVALPGAT